MSQDFLNLVREKAVQKLLFLPHAMRQMTHPDRMISTAEVRKAICSPKDEYLAIITAYVPTEDQWGEDFKSRRKK